MAFRNSIIGGMGKLIRQMIQSPNYVAGSAGWTINRDGSAEFNNATVRGLLQAGSLTAGSISNSVIGSSTLINDTIMDTDIVIDDTGGTILVYAVSGQTVVTFNVAGANTFAVPAGVTSLKVEAWGAGGGAGSGGSQGSHIGGSGGGGGEYACEPNYTVVPLAVLNYTVGTKGLHGASNIGTDGASTVFDTAVVAHGGKGASSTATRPGGIGSTNTLHFNGGSNGVPTTTSSTGGGGGGGSGGLNNAGNPGTSSTSAVGAAGGAAVTGGGAGGAGGNNAAVGSNGAAPGGGGGGGGATGLHAGGDGANGQVRITYGGTRVLIASIAGNAGVDRYGNAYVRGFRTNLATTAGLSGGYYEELAIPAGIVCATGAFTNLLANASNKLISDYGSAYSLVTGKWTAPADGVYDINVVASLATAFAANGRGVLAFSGAALGTGTNYSQDERSVIGAVGSYSSNNTITRFFTAGTAVFISLFQSSGVAHNTSPGFIIFARRG